MLETFRRLFVCCSVLAIPLLAWTGTVRAQACQPLSNASIGLPNYPILLPNEMGGVALSSAVYASNVNGSTPSQNITVTQGTSIGVSVTTYNAVSRSWYYTVDGGSTHYGAGSSSGFSGTQTWNNPNAWLANNFDVGHTMTFVNIAYDGLNQTGNQSQVRSTFSVVSGSGPSLIYEDDFPTSYFLQLTVPFSGSTSMIQTENCPNARNAIHSAPQSGTFTNPTSGQTLSFTSTGNSFCSNCAFSENSPPVALSFLPRDAPPQTTTTDKLECSIAGVFLTQIQRTGDKTQNQRIDKKMWTKVKIASTVPASDGGYYVDIWCQEYPPTLPIWAPNEIYTDAAPLNTVYWTAQTCSSSPPGTDPGPGWTCPPISGGPGPGNPKQFFPSMSSVKGSCNTNVNTPAPY